MKRLVWVHDAHLEFADVSTQEAFFQNLVQAKPDLLLLGGDTSTAKSICEILRQLAALVPCDKIAFVLGNHDFYDGSIAEVNGKIDALCAEIPKLIHLSRGAILSLDDRICLIGHGGWGDGCSGSRMESPVQMSDFYMIEEFRECEDKAAIYRLMEKLGQEAADFYRAWLPKALERFETVYILAHVPPFLRATCHEGQISGNDFLPLFCNVLAGEAIREVAKKFPHRKVLVLCGHTHSYGVCEEENVRIWAGKADYGIPRIQSVIETDKID